MWRTILILTAAAIAIAVAQLRGAEATILNVLSADRETLEP
jgi:hypothetical protein